MEFVSDESEEVAEVEEFDEELVEVAEFDLCETVGD